MRGGGPTPHEMEELARKLEAFLNGLNAKVLQLAKIDPEGVAQVFVEAQAQLLQFDASAKLRFEAAVEEARIKSLARDSFLMSCLLTSAVALKQFKREPRNVSDTGFKARIAARLRAHSTGKTALWTFTVASFYAVVGSAAYRKLTELKDRKPVLPA